MKHSSPHRIWNGNQCLIILKVSFFPCSHPQPLKTEHCQCHLGALGGSFCICKCFWAMEVTLTRYQEVLQYDFLWDIVPPHGSHILKKIIAFQFLIMIDLILTQKLIGQWDKSSIIPVKDCSTRNLLSQIWDLFVLITIITVIPNHRKCIHVKSLRQLVH